jgi:hypothetical protein
MEIVLSTREQIESRNPLAFAPKVIRTSEPGQELGVRGFLHIFFLFFPLLSLITILPIL